MQLEAIDSIAGLEQLRSEWSGLFLRCPRATPFQAPQWLIPWTRHLFGGGAIRALALRDAGELVGFAPLFCWGIGRRRVSFLGAGISDYGDLLFAPARERECADSVWRFLANTRREWDELDLQEVREGAGLLEGRVAVPCSVCPVLDLSTYPDAMDRKHRTDVRRAQNKLQNHSEISRVGFDDFLLLYEMRWGPMEATLQRFHCEVNADFHLLRIDSAPAAAIYTLTAGRTIYCYLSGYDPAMAKLSPGAVLLGWVIEEAVANGLQEVDFLRKPEAYKYLWGARDRINYKL
jgi:CelD/BcsL family acetyltransferase involved in cellulose biosynthesis